jgi:glycosyltransferase involved in cell wall biosynthesis
VFIEAAGLGVPVIGGDVDGVPETMLPGVSGLLVPPGDVPALARALDELLDDPARRRAMGRMGRAYVEGGRFSPAVTATQVEYVYLRWLAARGWRAGGRR